MSPAGICHTGQGGKRGFALWASLATVVLAGCSVPSAPAGPIALTYTDADAALLADADRTVIEQAADAYVRVVVLAPIDGRGPARTGIVSGASGCIVDPRGYIVTAGHIARRVGLAVRVTTRDRTRHAGIVVDVDPTRDLALLKIDTAADLHPAMIAQSRTLRAGDPVFSIGTPDNREGMVSVGSIAETRLAARIDYGGFGFDDGLELRMPVEPGQSGAPVFDTNGRLVGIIAGFGLGDTRPVPYVPTGIGYAVPSATLSAYLAESLPR